MKRKYFNDSSICWRIIGETGYEEEVEMIEKWENVKRTIKTIGKELSAAFDWTFDRLFSRIELTNEQFVYVLLSVVFIVANAILWVQKFQGFPITATERAEVVYKAKTPADQIPHTARIMANGDQLYHDLVYMSAQKEDGTYDFHENYEYVKPWLQKADLALGDFEGTSTFWGGFYRSCSCLFTGLRSRRKIWSILPLTVCKRRYSSRFAR